MYLLLLSLIKGGGTRVRYLSINRGRRRGIYCNGWWHDAYLYLLTEGGGGGISLFRDGGTATAFIPLLGPAFIY
jgi:hypothetical protein